jgi:ankyrin repeat protein
LNAKANIEAKDNAGQTPISLAAGNGHVDVGKELLNTKANIEGGDQKYGQLPIGWAASNGHVDVVKLLTPGCNRCGRS